MRSLLILIPFWVWLVLGSSPVWADDALEPVPSAEDAPVVMVRVGGNDITVEEFMRFLAQNPGSVREATSVEGKGRLLRVLVESELLRQAMIDAGVIAEDTTGLEQQQAFATFAQTKFPLPESPDSTVLRQYYENNKESFGIPASVRLSQIQLRVPEGATPEQKAAIRARAEAALVRLNEGEPFGEVAAELSENPKAKGTNGDLGFVWRKGHQWLEDALEGIQVGEYTGVLESPVGYDILMLTEERQAVISPFDEVRDTVAKRVQNEMQEAARQAYVRRLAEQIPVVLVQEDLKAAFPAGLFE